MAILKEYPMSFIAQINLQEMPIIQTDDDSLPTKGIIYFFYTTYPEAMYEDGDFDNNPKTSKVLFYDGEINNLIRTQPPKNYRKNCSILVQELHLDLNGVFPSRILLR